MKYLATIGLSALVLLASCKSEPKNQANDAGTSSTAETVESENQKKEQSILEKIASANGIENWPRVEELKFTFNVDREGNPHFERTWIWKPKTNEISAMTAEDTLIYNRNEMDSTVQKTNANFINDKFWLLAPINFKWDEQSIVTEHTMETEAPISSETMQKLTVTYDNQGGYTPGDAYDVYFGDDYIVREWVYRKGNQAEPSLITTWEDYTEKGGLKIAEMHQNEEGDFKLYFTDVEVTTE